ncbi:MAG: hypothetical protein AAF541_19530 [Pseudomonadota bacterium]
MTNPTFQKQDQIPTGLRNQYLENLAHTREIEAAFGFNDNFFDTEQAVYQYAESGNLFALDVQDEIRDCGD